MSIANALKDYDQLKKAEITYMTWGHLEQPEQLHNVVIHFAMDENGSTMLLTLESPTHERSPGIYYAACDCIAKVSSPISQKAYARGKDAPAGLYKIETTYTRGKCFTSRKYCKVSLVAKA